MSFYTIHINNKNPEKIVAIREGFNWLAFLLFPIWAIFNRLWLLLSVFLLAAIVLVRVVELFPNGDIVGLAVYSSVFVALGLTANDIKRYRLSRMGFKERDVLFAENKNSAVFRYISNVNSPSISENKNQASGPW